MAEQLVDELLRLQNAYAQLNEADATYREHLANPPWMLTVEIEKSSDGQRKTSSPSALERFYDEGLASRRLEEDPGWIEAQENSRKADITYSDYSEKIGALGECANNLSKLEEEKELLENELASLSEEEAGLIAEAEEEQDKALLEEIAAFEEKSPGTGFELIFGIGIAAVIYFFVWLLLLLPATVAILTLSSYELGVPAATSSEELISSPTTMAILIGLLVVPLVLYSLREVSQSKKYKKLIEELNQKRSHNELPESKKNEINQKIAAQKAEVDNHLDLVQGEIAKAEEKFHQEENKLNEFILSLDSNEYADLSFEDLTVKLLLETFETADQIEKERSRFILSLEDEFLAAYQKEKDEFDPITERLNSVVENAKAAFTDSLFLPSAGVSFSVDDLPNLDRVINKLQSNRASSLPEALNAVDIDLRAEKMHAEQMDATIKHNEEMEAHERERNRIAAEKAQAELTLQQEKAAQEAKHREAMAKAAKAANDEMLRMQKEATAAAEAAAAAEKQRLVEQQEEQKRAAQADQAQREATIANNLKHCQGCAHSPSYNVTETTYCNFGGWPCSESSNCTKYEKA